jgi:hypothetical protein
VNQILQWSSYARPVLKPDLSKALVAVWIGINDISDSAKYTFPRNNATNFEEFYTEIITTEFEALETVWKAGYRNYLVMNLPPLERTVYLTFSSLLNPPVNNLRSPAMLSQEPSHLQTRLKSLLITP